MSAFSGCLYRLEKGEREEKRVRVMGVVGEGGGNPEWTGARAEQRSGIHGVSIQQSKCMSVARNCFRLSEHG